MSDQFELRQFERLSLAIGPSAALRLCAFYAARCVYVPRVLGDDHVIVRLLGREAASYLQAEFGEQSISIPRCELAHLRRAGKIHALTQYDVPNTTVAIVMGITPQRVKQLRDQLRREGYDGLLNDFKETTNHAD